MFTGLIESIGSITNLSSNRASIKANFTQQLKIGDSVCVNGTCLTVTQIYGDNFSVDISPESFRVTNWKYKKNGDLVNLERAMQLSSRLDGHLVYGHVDLTSRIISIVPSSEFTTITIELPSTNKNLIVPKGSITIDGISLTIAEVYENSFDLAIIPHTLKSTTLNILKTGDFVNIEFDMIAKYIEKNLAIYHNKSKINMNFLEENGFL